MPRYEVAIATRDPRVRYLAVNLMKRLGISFIICAPDDRKCDTSQVVITTHDEASQIRASHLVVMDEKASDDNATAIDIMVELLDIRNPSVIAIGIDPGMKFGLALVADSVAIYAITASTPSIASNHTLNWIDIIQKRFCNSVLVRVGAGSRLYSALYLRALMKRKPSRMKIEMVDERHTTKRGESDKSSATLIASRTGRPVSEEDFVLDAKVGYVRSLTRLITKVTEGRLVLTPAQAKSILLDEISLDEVLGEMHQ